AYGMSCETWPVTRICTWPPLGTLSAVYVTVSASVSATRFAFVAPPPLWIEALTSSTPSGSGSVRVVGTQGAAFGSEHETVTTHCTWSPGPYGPVLSSVFWMPHV